MRSLSSSVPHPPGCSLTKPSLAANQSLVWLWDEKDLATEQQLTDTRRRAAALAEPSVVVDMSELPFAAQRRSG